MAHRIILVIAMLLSISIPAELSSQQQPFPPITPQPGQPKDNSDTFPTRMQKEMAKKANEQRQAELKRDTDKLLKLSTELKAYVDKSNENVLSLDVIRKAEEIEKLAHSVRTKMRGNN